MLAVEEGFAGAEAHSRLLEASTAAEEAVEALELLLFSMRVLSDAEAVADALRPNAILARTVRFSVESKS